MNYLLLLGLVAAVTAYKTYNGYQVLLITPTIESDQNVIKSLRDDIDLDFWDDNRRLGVGTRAMIPPHRVEQIKRILDAAAIPYVTDVQNVGVNVVDEHERLAKAQVYNISDYNTFDDIMTELDLMAGSCPAALSCSMRTLGLSVEGRPIRTMDITLASLPAGRRGYWIDSAIHAREWLAPATHLNIMDSFTRNYGVDPDITYLVDTYDWHFTPVMNPDGYVYSWTDERYWRKSRNANAGSSCIGTDLNRNYDANWMSDGTSTNPCSDTYGGESPNSAQETQVVAAEIAIQAPSLDGLMSIHTAAQMWLHPWGHTEGGRCADPPANQGPVIQAAITAVDTTHADLRNWEAGDTCTTIYPASGTTGDYGHVAGVPFSITPELRGPDFVIGAEHIPLSHEETWNGIKAFVAEIETILP